MGIIRCDGGDMMCADLFLGGITMLVGCSLGTSIEWRLLVCRFYR